MPYHHTVITIIEYHIYGIHVYVNIYVVSVTCT